MISKMKLRHTQAHVPHETIIWRLELCRWYLSLTKTMHELSFPGDRAGFGSNVELLLVYIAVFIGDGEGKPTTATKIGHHCGMPRATVYRRLEELIVRRKVVREKTNYFVAPGAAPVDPEELLPKVSEKFPTTKRPKRTH